MKKSFLAAVPLTLMSLLGACALNKPDLHYRDSSLQAPLSVPEEMDSPRYSQSMDVPPAGSSGAPDDTALSADGLDIEQPPDMRTADSQGLGKE